MNREINPLLLYFLPSRVDILYCMFVSISNYFCTDLYYSLPSAGFGISLFMLFQFLGCITKSFIYNFYSFQYRSSELYISPRGLLLMYMRCLCVLCSYFNSFPENWELFFLISPLVIHPSDELFYLSEFVYW